MNQLNTAALRGCVLSILFYSSATWADGDSALQTVVVSASPITDNDRLATIVESVDRDEILRSGGANLADALANTPGVTGTGFASGASRPVIRGFDANRVKVLEDGIGSFDVSDVGPDHGVPIDPLSAQRIEVVRGAATLRYGSQAIGGVVNAINNRVPTALPTSPFAGEASALYGTNADTLQGSAQLDAALGSFAFHADGFDRDANNYDTPDGRFPNSFFRGDGYSFGSSYFFDQNRVGAAIIHYDSKYGIPGDTSYIDMSQTKELFRSSFAPGIGAFRTLNVEGGYADYEHSELEPDGTLDATFKDHEWDARAEALFDAIGPFSASALGVQVQRRNFSALGEAQNYLLPTTTRSEAAFAFGDSPLTPRLHLHTGLRIESVAIDGTPSSGVPSSLQFTPVSGAVGLLFTQSTALNLGLTLSSAARAPSQTELFAKGPHDGPGTFETGDPDLKVERANSIEATARVRSGRAQFEGAVWGTKFDNFIYGNLTGRTCDDQGVCQVGDGNGLKELNYSQVGATFRGTEAKTTVDLVSLISGTIQATALADYVRATLESGGNVPRIPPYHLGAGLNWDGQNTDASFLVRYTARQNDVSTAATPTAGFVSVDAQAAWRPFAGSPGTEIALVGHNLTNTTQRNAVALNKDDVILPGRDIRLMLRAKF